MSSTKRNKFKVSLISTMDFASVIVFFVRHLKLHFAKQCETQQQTNCEAPFATNESLITHEHGVRH